MNSPREQDIIRFAASAAAHDLTMRRNPKTVCFLLVYYRWDHCYELQHHASVASAVEAYRNYYRYHMSPIFLAAKTVCLAVIGAYGSPWCGQVMVSPKFLSEDSSAMHNSIEEN